MNKDERLKIVQQYIDTYMGNEQGYISKLWRFYYRRYDAIETFLEIIKNPDTDEECMKKKTMYKKILAHEDHFPYLVEILRKGLEDEIDKDRDPRP